MARIAGVDLPREKRVEIGLTYIYGIGLPTSKLILEKANINPDTRVKDLTEEEVGAIRKIIDSEYVVEGDLRRTQKKPARSRTEHQEQQPHPQGSQEDCWPQEEVGRRR